MAQIDREGTFRGHALELAVNTTKNGFPQLVVKFAAEELHNAEEAQWESWAEYAQEIIGYFVLFGAKGKCLNYEQVQKALGWDGVSFADLDGLEDLETRRFQLRVEWDEYNGTKALKAVWIDAADATPGGAGLRKLEAPALTALDAKFAGQLGAKKITPKSAPKGKPKVPASPEKAPQAEPPKTSPPARARRTKEENDGGSGLPTSCSREDAWAKICELKMASVTDDQLSEAWVATIDKVVGADVDGSDISSDQWATIRDKVLDTIPSIRF